MEKFYFTSVIRLTALTIHSLAVALSGGPAGLKTFADGIIMQFVVDTFQGHKPDASQLIKASNTHVLF